MRKVAFDEEKAKRLRKEGMSYRKIAKHFGVSRWTINRRLDPQRNNAHREAQNKKQRTKKAYLIEYKGGGCSMCGYNKCHTSLSFHHLNQEKKSFGIGDRKSAPLKELLKEADKTILVCNNCHGEIHEGLHNEFINNLLSKMV